MFQFTEFKLSKNKYNNLDSFHKGDLWVIEDTISYQSFSHFSNVLILLAPRHPSDTYKFFPNILKGYFIKIDIKHIFIYV
jgi:hypothetical protein